MHLPEGALPAGQAAVYTGLAVAGLAAGLREYRNKSGTEGDLRVKTAVMSAVVFVVSMVPIPVPGASSAHPGGTPLAALFIGPRIIFPVSAVALALQAVLLGEGGITTLGANILAMAFGGLASWLVFRSLDPFSRRLGAGLAGFLGSVGIYTVTALQLALVAGKSPGAFWGLLLAFAPSQLPLAVLEGLFTAMVVSYIGARRPLLLERRR